MSELAMNLKLEELQKRESILDSLPIPMGHALKARYRKVQAEMERRQLISIHEKARERLSGLLDEIETELARSG